MQLPFKHRLIACLVLSVYMTVQAADVSGWEFEWNLKTEKPRHRPLIAKYSKRADGHLAKGNFWRARYYYRKLYKTSRSLHNRGNAKLAIAVAHYGANNYLQAIKDLKETVDNYANFIPFGKALELEYTIAESRFAGKTDALFSSLDDEAIKTYQHIQEVAPFSPYAEKALYSAGMLEVRKSNFNAGTILLTKLINRYPQSTYVIQARFELTHALLKMAEMAEGDPLIETRARSELLTLRSAQLTNEQVNRLNALETYANDIAVKNLLFLGAFYQRKEHWNPDTSRRYLNEVTKKFGDHPRAGEAIRLLANLPGSRDIK